MDCATCLLHSCCQRVTDSVRAWNGVGACALNAWLLSDRLDGTAREEARRAFERSLELEPGQARIEKLLRTYAP